MIGDAVRALSVEYCLSRTPFTDYVLITSYYRVDCRHSPARLDPLAEWAISAFLKLGRDLTYHILDVSSRLCMSVWFCFVAHCQIPAFTVYTPQALQRA
eukprot:51850-Eustigmatos_ZCMA.PRE.1